MEKLKFDKFKIFGFAGLLVALIGIFFPLYSTISKKSFYFSQKKKKFAYCVLKQTAFLFKDDSFEIVKTSCPDWKEAQQQWQEDILGIKQALEEMGLDLRSTSGWRNNLNLIFLLCLGTVFVIYGLFYSQYFFVIIGSFIFLWLSLVNCLAFIPSRFFKPEIGGILVFTGGLLILMSSVLGKISPGVKMKKKAILAIFILILLVMGGSLLRRDVYKSQCKEGELIDRGYVSLIECDSNYSLIRRGWPCFFMWWQPTGGEAPRSGLYKSGIVLNFLFWFVALVAGWWVLKFVLKKIKIKK